MASESHDPPRDGVRTLRTDWGAKIQSSEDGLHLELAIIRRVQVFDIAELLSHDITRVAGLTSHTLRFLGGGCLHYAYNGRGDLIEFRGGRFGATVDREGNVTVRDRK